MADCDVEQTAIWQRATLRPSMQRTAGAAAQPGLSPIARGADDVQCDPHGRLAHLHAALPRRHLGRQRIAQLAGDLRGMWGPQRLGKARARDSGRQTKASRHQGRRAGSTWCRSQLQAVGLPGCLTSMSLGKALRIMAGLQPTGGAGTAADQWHTARSSMRRKARGAHGWMARRAGAAAMEAGHLKAGAVVLRTTRHSSLSWVLKKERCPTGLNSCGQAGGPCARIKCAQIASWMPGCTTFKHQHHPPTHLIHGISWAALGRSDARETMAWMRTGSDTTTTFICSSRTCKAGSQGQGRRAERHQQVMRRLLRPGQDGDGAADEHSSA